MKDKLTSLELKWIVYDIGNSAFILLCTTIIPIYFNSISSAAGIAESDYLTYWSYATSIATIIVVFAGPIFGTLADYKDKKKRYKFMYRLDNRYVLVEQFNTIWHTHLAFSLSF